MHTTCHLTHQGERHWLNLDINLEVDSNKLATHVKSLSILYICQHLSMGHTRTMVTGYHFGLRIIYKNSHVHHFKKIYI